VPVGGAGAAKRATATKARPCWEREAEPLSSSKQGEIAPLAAFVTGRVCPSYSASGMATRMGGNRKAGYVATAIQPSPKGTPENLTNRRRIRGLSRNLRRK
jgi:hypothetical protein